jgi:hypothetical protein
MPEPTPPTEKESASLNTSAFWIDQILATLIAGAGIDIRHDFPLVGGGLFAAGVGWLLYLRWEHKAMSPQVRTPNLIAVVVLFLATVVMGYDIYDRHHPAVLEAGNPPACIAWDDNKPLERVYGSTRPFVNESVVLDGRHFLAPVFDDVTFIYNGTGGVQIDNAQFISHPPSPVTVRLLSRNEIVTQTLSLYTMFASAVGCSNIVDTTYGPAFQAPAAPAP